MFNTILRGSLLSIFIMLFLALPAFAVSEDEGLYDAPPPEGSAFARFIHADPNVGGDISPKLNGKSLDGVKFTGVKPYGVIPSGKTMAEIAGITLEFDADSDSYYSLVLQKGELRAVKEPELQDQLKAQIIVHNLTSKDDISLKTADGKVSVVGPLTAGETKNREINPIKVSFAIYSGDEKYADLVDWPLERKESYIIVVFEKDGAGVAIYDRARVSAE